MKFSRTSLFLRSYKNLDGHRQRPIDVALRKLASQPYHPFYPGLQVHKLAGVYGLSLKVGQAPPAVWEMHATDELLVTFQYGEDEILLRNCGHHKNVLRNP